MNPRVLVALVTIVLVVGVSAGVVGAEFGDSYTNTEVDTQLDVETGDVGSTSSDVLLSTPDADSVSTPVTPATHGADPASTPATSTTHDGPVLERSMELRHAPDRPGEFDVVVRFEVPDSITGLEIGLESGARNVSTEDFASTGEQTYEWTGDADAPEIRFTMPANLTRDLGHHADIEYDPTAGIEHGPIAGIEHDPTPEPTTGERSERNLTADRSLGDGYTFVDTGTWGVVAVPQLEITWRGTGATAVERTVDVDGPGAVGNSIAYFGEVEEYERTVRGETIRLGVPAAVDLEESPEDVLDALAFASDELRVGARSDEAFVVAIPADDVDLAARGVQYGERDAWVVDDAELETVPNVWLHEYVHTRQAYVAHDVGTTLETRWLLEAQAEYYAATLALEKGLIEFDVFEAFLDRGTRDPYVGGVLADPSTWDGEEVDYVKGPLVYGTIDRELRDRTDGEATLEAVFRDLNDADQRVTEADFLGSVETHGGSEARALAEAHTHSDEAPDPWTRSEHDAVFGGPTAALEYALADEEPVRVEGPLRTISESHVPTILIDETVTIPIRASNVGDATTAYETTLRVDGQPIDSATGSLDPGEERIDWLVWTPDEPGTYEVSLGDHRTTVLVRQPATGVVTALAVDPDRVEPGEPVRVTATVENDAEVHADVAVEFRTADGVVAAERIALEPGGVTTVETELVFDDEAKHEVAVDDHSVTVHVAGNGMRADVEETADAIPGFGALGAVLGMSVILAVIFWRRFTR